jgi:hypothetical protein
MEGDTPSWLLEVSFINNCLRSSGAGLLLFYLDRRFKVLKSIILGTLYVVALGYVNIIVLC